MGVGAGWCSRQRYLSSHWICQLHVGLRGSAYTLTNHLYVKSPTPPTKPYADFILKAELVLNISASF